MLHPKRFDALSFDCYGTLIDWESGILSALRPVLERHRVWTNDADALRLYGEIEPEVESGPFLPYREVLQQVVRGFGLRLGFTPTEDEVRSLPESLANWQPFPDTVPALRRLKSRYKLFVISNVDDDLFAGSARHLQVPFDDVITAQQVGSYKPSPRNFEFALQKTGVPRDRLLHVAESLFHDVAVCNRLGIASVWVNRRKKKGGVAATPIVDAKPDAEVEDLAELAALLGL